MLIFLYWICIGDIKVLSAVKSGKELTVWHIFPYQSNITERNALPYNFKRPLRFQKSFIQHAKHAKIHMVWAKPKGTLGQVLAIFTFHHIIILWSLSVLFKEYTEIRYLHGPVQHRIGYTMVTLWTWHADFRLFRAKKNKPKSRSFK